MEELVVGIDIGGTNVKIGLVNEKGKILEKEVFSLKEYPEIDDFVSTVSEKILKMYNKQKNNYSLKGVGIGAPNGNFYSGTIEFAPNLPWKGIIPLAELINKKLDMPVYLTNDANAAAVGEMIYGGAKGLKDFLVVTLGTGLGSGFVANGKLILGHDGFAGELGHTIVKEDGRLCGCGRKGCLETYASASGIKRTILKYLSVRKEDSLIRSVPSNKISSKIIYDAAIQGDIIAQEAFEYTGKILGMSLANATAITSPEVIFLNGGLAKAGELIFDPTRRHFEENLLNIFKGKIKILPSDLPENSAAILGAAALVWKES